MLIRLDDSVGTDTTEIMYGCLFTSGEYTRKLSLMGTKLFEYLLDRFSVAE